MSAHSFFKSQCLVNAGKHVRVVLLCLVVHYKATFPQRAYGFHTLELVRFLALVACNRQLVAARFTLTAELVQYGVLHKIGFHIPTDGNALLPGPLVQVITPPHHFGNGGLANKGAEVVKHRACLSPKFRSLVVILY